MVCLDLDPIMVLWHMCLLPFSSKETSLFLVFHMNNAGKGR